LQRLVLRARGDGTPELPLPQLENGNAAQLRQGAAMALLRRGVDLSVIALWLGHESTETTQIHLRADMQLKEKALARATPCGVVPNRFRLPDALLAFLESL
jgi:integrase